MVLTNQKPALHVIFIYDNIDQSHCRRDKHGRRYDKETPLPTPSFKHNKWARRDERSRRTDRRDGEDSKRKNLNDEDYKDEEKRLDREWYGLDEGFDNDNNVFSNMSNDYVRNKEAQMEVKRVKHLTAKQAAWKKDNEKWEQNRMLRSGAVTKLDYDEDFDEESAAKVNLIVTNIIPPFLDGR